MQDLCFIIELLVGEETRIHSTMGCRARMFAIRLLAIFLADTQFYFGGYPFVIFVGLNLSEEKPFITLDTFDIFFGDLEHIPPYEWVLLFEFHWIGFVEWKFVVRVRQNGQDEHY